MKRSFLSRRAFQLACGAAFAAGVSAVACSGSTTGSGFGGDGGGGSGGPTTLPTQGTGTSTTNPGTGTILNPGSGTSSSSSETGSGSGSGPCTYAATDTTDHDGDGWSGAEGDCNDCNKYINPGAYDIPGNGVDEDCNGTPDDEPTGCDASLSSVATTTGSDGAKAMDICRNTTSAPPKPMKTWGLISADYVLPDGSSSQAGNPNYELGFGILGPKYGTYNKTQQGSHMLGLSSGTARQPTDPGYQDVGGFDKMYTTGAPNGFPAQTPACPGVTFGQPHDGAAIRIVVRVPTNALTMSFDSNFFSYEFPDYVCSPYNDTYVVIMTPSPQGEPASANNNIAFDSMNNIISVNAGFLTVCDPNTQAGNTVYPCTEGPTNLTATGFGVDTTGDEDHASTDWLTTTVSVANLAGQEVTLLFAIWDSSDGILDSTVLVDNMHWTFATAPNQVPPVTSTPPMTTPTPK
jgi:hypothetical protein